MAWPYLLAVLLAGYLLGSIPFGLMLTRLAGLGDIRRIGSGNIGATNVLRTGNKALAAATLLLDGGKGAVAVLVAQHLYGPDAAIVAGAGAFLGHLFPVWLNFHGGKGVATTIGILLALAWPVGADRLRRLAARRAAVPLLVAGRADRRRRRARRRLVFGQPPDRRPRAVPRRGRVAAPSREHRAAAEGPGIADPPGPLERPAARSERRRAREESMPCGARAGTGSPTSGARPRAP